MKKCKKFKDLVKTLPNDKYHPEVEEFCKNIFKDVFPPKNRIISQEVFAQRREVSQEIKEKYENNRKIN